MRQLGLLKGSNAFGDELPKKQPPDKYKTKSGELKAKAAKAIGWYMKEHDLTAKATGTYPIYYFGTPDGQEQPVYIEEIVADYESREREAGARN